MRKGRRMAESKMLTMALPSLSGMLLGTTTYEITSS